MEIFQVRYVLAAAGRLNFTKAASQCNISQPALTKAIKSLENELGAALFLREGKQVQLTEFGRSLLPHLQQIASETEAAKALAENFRLLNQVPIRLGILSTVGHLKLSRFLAKFQRDFQGVELEVSEASIAELKTRLEHDQLDLAVLNPLDGVGGLNVVELYRERYVVIFPPDHRLSALNGIKLSDLSNEPYVDRLSCEMREMVLGVCKDRNISLYARFRSEREDWVQSMVLGRIGFAFMPEYSVTSAELSQRPLTDPEITRTIALVSVPGRKYTPATAAMMRAAKQFDWPG